MGLFINPVGLVLVGGALVAAERWWPKRAQRTLRQGWRTDVAHLVFTHTLEVVLTALLVVLISRAAGLINSGLASTLPRGVQFVVALLVADATGYLWHRFEHRGGFWWRVHAVHHSSRQLDWLASARRHPLGSAVGRAVAFTPLALLGFTPDVLGGAAGLLTLWAIVLHANLRLSLRWLRFIVATPAFHQTHHALEHSGRGVNFAGLLPVWDVLGGTFCDEEAQTFGCDAPVPEDYLGQLASPFRRRSGS
jgi:sterol desaturase/sphingolipid hydroxylase (fatty acid hydroxylase superfamily)